MALSDPELDEVNALGKRLTEQRAHVDLMDAYYNGVQRLEQLGLAIPEDLRRFVTIVSWPATCVDALEERLDLEGFRLPGSDDPDDELWDIWQANDLDEESQLAHLDALVARKSYVCVGSPDAGDVPLVTVESPREMTHDIDPRTRRVRAAWRHYREPTTLVRDAREFGTLYLPDATVHVVRGERGQWVEEDRDQHRLGMVPVVPIVNQARISDRFGASEQARAITLTDAAARALTNAQIATELLAVPQRYVLGATKGDFVDPATGKMIPTWESYLGAIWALGNENATVGQMPAADLRNFETIVSHYRDLLAGSYGLPLRYFGANTANPPSAEGIRADESRLVKRAERRQRAFGGSWEKVMRLVKRLVDGDWDPDLARMECLWRDPATPTRAQAADAAVKLHQAGLLPREAAWEDLGYSATRRKKLALQAEAEALDPLLEALKAQPEPVVVPDVGGG